MRRPRMRIWVAMFVVALAALGSAGWVLWKRSREYSKRAAILEKRLSATSITFLRVEVSVELHRRSIPSIPDEDIAKLVEKNVQHEEQFVARLRNDVSSGRAQAAAYRRAARYPWLGAPHLPPDQK
jgi:hypothetical protein